MGALASIVLNDGQGTPVAHTFTPARIQDGVAILSDMSGGIALGYPRVTHLVRGPNKGSRNWKVTAKVVLPVLEVTSPSTASGIQPAPTLAYNLEAHVEIILPERSSLAERKNLNAYMKNLMAHAIMTSAVENFEALY